jgi:benzil reductase ((S)-benzoin forming)
MKSPALRFVEFDLASVAETVCAATLFNTLAAALGDARPDEVSFISNAGVIEPLGISGAGFCPSMIAATAVNFLAPALMTAVCSEYALNHGLPLKILNVSSGAATRPIPGWEVYCATKAAARMYLDVLSCEDHQRLEIVHLDPGVLDTKMQASIQASSPGVFPLQEQFAVLKEEGRLKNPLSVALQI